MHDLRTDPAYNQHLSIIEGTAEDQRIWIESYKKREADGCECYFIISRRDGVPCGTVRLYDFVGETFTWGSWILDQNKPSKAALESAYLVYEAAFDLLKCSEARFDVRSNNHKTLAFHRRFGAVETHMDEIDVFFKYTRSQFNENRATYLALLEGRDPE